MNFESFLTRWVKHELIEDCNHDPYLSRWFLLRTKWLYVFIHKFHRSDEDRALHDHPWNYISIILKHGYWEHSEDICPDCLGHSPNWCPLVVHCWRCLSTGLIKQTRFIKPGSIIWRPATWRHRIELINLGEPKQAWTIIFRFRRIRDWGFWTADGFVPWRQWWRANCE